MPLIEIEFYNVLIVITIIIYSLLLMNKSFRAVILTILDFIHENTIKRIWKKILNKSDKTDLKR